MNNKIKELNEIINISKKDTQINTQYIFSKFTDFQNIMLSYISLLELLYVKIENKTIKDLYLENIHENTNIEYEKIIITAEDMIKMSDAKYQKQYRNLVLGKLIRYGFSEIKITKKITGKHGFDAFVLEDKKRTKILYFPCTNLIEHEDYIYDSYPIMNSINIGTKIIGNIFGKQIYQSQQQQAKELLKQELTNNPNKKIHVAGFSLGGSLAEYAYLNNYKKYKNLGNIILFNPYHNNLNKKEVKILKQSKKLKLYVCEGDTVSCVFNYYDFYEIAKPVYINYKFNINKTNEEIKNNKSIINEIILSFKNEYIDYLIKKCKLVQKKTNNKFILSINQPIENIINKLTKLKDVKTPISVFLKTTTNIVKKIPGIKSLEESTNYLKFLLNINYIENILTSTHLTYTVDYYKKLSFNKYGKIRKKIIIGNKSHQVSYPSFTEVNKNDIGNIIDVLKNNK